MASQSWTLKAELHGEKRRLKDWVPVGEEPTVTLVRSGVAVLFDMLPTQELKLQYKDNDGEVCTLTDTTLPDALSLVVERASSQTSRTLCVMVAPVTTEPADCLDGIPAPFQDGSVPLRASLEIDGINASNGASSSFQARAQHLGEATASLQAIAGQLVEDNKAKMGQLVEDNKAKIASVRATGEQISSEIQTKWQEGRSRSTQQLEETTASLHQLVEDNKATIASVRATGGQISSEIQTKVQEGREGFEKRSQQVRGVLRGRLENRAQQLGEITASLQAIAGQLVEENQSRIACVRAAGEQVSSEIHTKVQEGREGFEKGFEIRSRQLRGDLSGASAVSAAGAAHVHGTDVQELAV